MLALELFRGKQVSPGCSARSAAVQTGGAGSCVLLKRVGPGAPVGEEDGEADGLEELGKDVQADGLKGLLLGEDLSEELEEFMLA